MNSRIPEKVKLQYFQSLLREEAFDGYQSLMITTEMNLNEVLTKFCKEITKDLLIDISKK